MPLDSTPPLSRGTVGAVLWTVVAATLLASALFLAFPAIDLSVSRLFFYPADRGFPLGWRPPLTYVRTAGDLVVGAVVAALVAGILIKLARPERRSLVSPVATSLLLWSLAIGPGILVNLAFKNVWGRPRPQDIEAFGGSLPFVPPWTFTHYCAENCSFVSGEASSAIWLTALALVVPRRWRWPTLIVTTLFAAAISLNRIAFGGHFLSDVLIAWGLTLIVILLLYRFLYVRAPAILSDASLEGALTRAGFWLRRRLGKSAS